MKTTISIPDPIFKAAESAAKELGISRSEYFTKAVAEFTEKFEEKDLTDKLNAVYSEEDSSPDSVLVEMQWMSIRREDWRRTPI